MELPADVDVVVNVSRGGTRPIENVTPRREHGAVPSGVHVAERARGGLAEAMSSDRAGHCPAGGAPTLQGRLELPFVDLGTVASSPRIMRTDPRPVAVPDDVDNPRHDKASGFPRT